MTSTNDGKDVKINQTIGQKSKSYYIELYKSIDAGLSSDCVLRDRTRHLCEAWRRIHSLCQHSAPSTHPHLVSWLQRHTAKTVLQTEWQSPKSKEEYHKPLDEVINKFIEESRTATAGRNGFSPPWESQLVQRGEWFKKILANPWGHPVLRVLLDPEGQPPSDKEVLDWLKEERCLVFLTRLRQLAATKSCVDLALLLVSAVMDRFRAAQQITPDADQVDDVKDKPKPGGSEPSFADVLKAEAGFTVDAWELLIDIEFVLLHKRDKRSRCIELAKQMPLRGSYHLVERLQNRVQTSARETKLWKNAKDVATLIAQVVVARCMVVGSCGGQVRSALYCCAGWLARLLPRAKLPPAAAALAAPAATARHLHTLATAVHAELQGTPEMKPFVCELYVRAITAGMNELERLKLKTEKGGEARAAEQTLATWFIQLGALLVGSARMRCECELTAFSLHPAAHLLDRIRAAPALPAVDIQEPKSEQTTSEFGSWASDSRSQTNFVKTSETLNLKQHQHQANVLSTAILAEGEALGFSPELCQDIAVLLSGPRLKTLSWDMDRELLLENCRTYIERTGGGTKSLTTELKYLNLDPRDFAHLPVEEEDETDIYYGIEKGYEHLVEEYHEPEEIWQDADDLEQTQSTYSDDTESTVTQRVRRKKKTKKEPLPYDEDLDPLSLVAEAKRIEKKKERPHSKERSKDGATSKSKMKPPKDPLEIDPSDKKTDHNVPKKDVIKAKKKRERKNKDKTATSTKSSLSKLVGMKVSKIKEKLDEPKTSVSDSDYDSQGKSSLNSLNSEGNDPDVLFDGLFSMDELKSPDRSSDKLGLMKNNEVYLADGSVTINSPANKYSTNAQNVPSKIKAVDKMSPPPRSVVNEQPVDTSLNQEKLKTVTDEVKNSITRLIHFRRQKALNELNKLKSNVMTHSNAESMTTSLNKDSPARAVFNTFRPQTPLYTQVSPKVGEVPEIPKVNINKNQSQKIADLKNEVDYLLHKQNYVATRPVIQYAQKPIAIKPDRLNKQPSTKLANTSLERSEQKHVILKNTEKKPISRVQELKPEETVDKSNVNKQPLTQNSLQKFLHELHKSINAGTRSDSSKSENPTMKKEIRPISRVTPVLTSKAELKSTPQSAKQLVQQQKKTENTLNTFSRLSYMHKSNKMDLKIKELNAVTHQDQALHNTSLSDFDRMIHTQKVAKRKHVQSSDLVISRLDKTHLKSNITKQHAALKNVEQPKPASSSSVETDHPLISSMLQYSRAHAQNVSATRQEKQIKDVQVKKARDSPTPNHSALSEKDQNELLLLLRQKRKQNATLPICESTSSYSLQSSHYSSPNIAYQPNITFSEQCHVTTRKTDVPSPSFSESNIKYIEHPITKVPRSIQSSVDFKLFQQRQTNVVKTGLNSPRNEHVLPNKSQKTETISEIDTYTSKRDETNISDKATDWESVMNLILSHKTPRRGPNALEMSLNKEGYNTSDLDNNTVRTQRVIMQSYSKQTITKVQDNVLTSKSNTNADQSTLNTTTIIRRSKTENVLKDTKVKNIGPKTQIQNSRSVLRTPIQLHNNKSNVIMPIQTESSKKTIYDKMTANTQVSKKSMSFQKKPSTCTLARQDDLATLCIPNSEYDLLEELEELMDDELRQEIGELSDDESYGATGSIQRASNIFRGINKTTSVTQEKGVETSAFTNRQQTIKMPVNTMKNENLKSIHDSNIGIHHTSNVVSTSPKYCNTQYNVQDNVQTTNLVQQLPRRVIVTPNCVNNVSFNINNSQVKSSDQTNTLVAAMPQTTAFQNVVLFGTDIVYQPCTIQTPIPITSLASNTYVAFGNQPNMTLYQTTQFTAPVVNPLIIGNAITVPMRHSVEKMQTAAHHTFPEESNNSEEQNILKHEVDKSLASESTWEVTREDYVQNDNAESKSNQSLDDILKSEQDMFDLNYNKSCDRKVLSEVQEKFTVNDKVDTIIQRIRKPSFDHGLNNETTDDICRLHEKRLAIMNRNIFHRCDSKPIPLTYAPLEPKQLDKINVPEIQTSVEKANILNDEQSGKSSCFKKKVLINSLTQKNDYESSDVKKDEIVSSVDNNENCKENNNDSSQCRRILLRSSNRLPISKATNIPTSDTFSKRTKVRLKPSISGSKDKAETIGIQNITTQSAEVKLNNEPRKKKVNRTKSRSNIKKTSVKNKCHKKVKSTKKICIKNKKPRLAANSYTVTQPTEVIDVEEQIIGSKIPRKVLSSETLDKAQIKNKSGCQTVTSVNTRKQKGDDDIISRHSEQVKMDSDISHKQQDLYIQQTVSDDGIASDIDDKTNFTDILKDNMTASKTNTKNEMSENSRLIQQIPVLETASITATPHSIAADKVGKTNKKNEISGYSRLIQQAPDLKTTYITTSPHSIATDKVSKTNPKNEISENSLLIQQTPDVETTSITTSPHSIATDKVSKTNPKNEISENSLLIQQTPDLETTSITTSPHSIATDKVNKTNSKNDMSENSRLIQQTPDLETTSITSTPHSIAPDKVGKTNTKNEISENSRLVQQTPDPETTTTITTTPHSIAADKVCGTDDDLVTFKCINVSKHYTPNNCGTVQKPTNDREINLDAKSTEMLAEKNIKGSETLLQSYKNSIIIENLPDLHPGDPHKKSVRIKLPTGRVFKATMNSKGDESFDTLFSDPVVKNVLLSNLTDKKRYTLNIQHVATTIQDQDKKILKTRVQEIKLHSNTDHVHKNTVPQPLETISLLSDEEEDESYEYFRTEFGNYKVKMNETDFQKHRKRLNQKCFVKLKRLCLQSINTDIFFKQNDVTIRENLVIEDKVQSLITEALNIHGSQKNEQFDNPRSIPTESDVIEIDDSSNDSLKLNGDWTIPNYKNDKITELKSLLLKDLGITSPIDEREQSIDNLTLYSNNVNNASLNTNVSIDSNPIQTVSNSNPTEGSLISAETNLGLNDSNKPNSDLNIVAESSVTELNVLPVQDYHCYVKLKHCDDLVKKYEQIKLIKQNCFVQLLRCDQEIDYSDMAGEKENEECDIIDNICQDDIPSDSTIKECLSRSGSFSILNEFTEFDVEMPVIDEIDRSSPVIEVFETIATLSNKCQSRCNSPVINAFETIARLKNNSLKTELMVQSTEKKLCESDWYMTKYNYQVLYYKMTHTRYVSPADDHCRDIVNSQVSAESKIVADNASSYQSNEKYICDSEWYTTKYKDHIVQSQMTEGHRFYPHLDDCHYTIRNCNVRTADSKVNKSILTIDIITCDAEWCMTRNKYYDLINQLTNKRRIYPSIDYCQDTTGNCNVLSMDSKSVFNTPSLLISGNNICDAEWCMTRYKHYDIKNQMTERCRVYPALNYCQDTAKSENSSESEATILNDSCLLSIEKNTCESEWLMTKHKHHVLLHNQIIKEHHVCVADEYCVKQCINCLSSDSKLVKYNVSSLVAILSKFFQDHNHVINQMKPIYLKLKSQQLIRKRKLPEQPGKSVVENKIAKIHDTNKSINRTSICENVLINTAKRLKRSICSVENSVIVEATTTVDLESSKMNSILPKNQNTQIGVGDLAKFKNEIVVNNFDLQPMCIRKVDSENNTKDENSKKDEIIHNNATPIFKLSSPVVYDDIICNRTNNNIGEQSLSISNLNNSKKGMQLLDKHDVKIMDVEQNKLNSNEDDEQCELQNIIIASKVEITLNSGITSHNAANVCGNECSNRTWIEQSIEKNYVETEQDYLGGNIQEISSTEISDNSKEIDIRISDRQNEPFENIATTVEIHKNDIKTMDVEQNDDNKLDMMQVIEVENNIAATVKSIIINNDVMVPEYYEEKIKLNSSKVNEQRELQNTTRATKSEVTPNSGITLNDAAVDRTNNCSISSGGTLIEEDIDYIHGVEKQQEYLDVEDNQDKSTTELSQNSIGSGDCISDRQNETFQNIATDLEINNAVQQDEVNKIHLMQAIEVKNNIPVSVESKIINNDDMAPKREFKKIKSNPSECNKQCKLQNTTVASNVEVTSNSGSKVHDAVGDCINNCTSYSTWIEQNINNTHYPENQQEYLDVGESLEISSTKISDNSIEIGDHLNNKQNEVFENITSDVVINNISNDINTNAKIKESIDNSKGANGDEPSSLYIETTSVPDHDYITCVGKLHMPITVTVDVCSVENYNEVKECSIPIDCHTTQEINKNLNIEYDSKNVLINMDTDKLVCKPSLGLSTIAIKADILKPGSYKQHLRTENDKKVDIDKENKQKDCNEIFEGQSHEGEDCGSCIDTNKQIMLTTGFDSGILLKGIEYDDPEMGACYMFPLVTSISESSECDSDANFEDLIQIIENDMSNKELKMNIPKKTYSKHNNSCIDVKLNGKEKNRKPLKRKIDMSDIKINCKKYRKGKGIDYPKTTSFAMTQTAYSKEFKNLFDYISSIKFSYSMPFHKDFINIENVLCNWPIDIICNNESEGVSEDESLFVDTKDTSKGRFSYSKDELTLAEEIVANYDDDTKYNNSTSGINESNFNMGFGEGSDRVIQNLERGGDISKFSAATLSDVKQSQPLLMSEDMNIFNSTNDEIKKLQQHLTNLRLRERVKSFFRKTKAELTYEWVKENEKDSSDFPFGLNLAEFIDPCPIEAIVQVVQVGQLPVSAAAQNPVTCDPRVTHVSDVSPSQCSAENSLNDDPQSAIKTEYTELTTADLSLPLVQDYAHHNQAMPGETHETSNLPGSEENITIETEIKSIVKIELMEEIPDDTNNDTENGENTETQSLLNKNNLNNVNYSFSNATVDTDINSSSDNNSNIDSIFDSAEKQHEVFPQQKQQNVSSEKTDQIAHAMNAAGITTTAETITNTRAHALVNILSQKLRQGAVGSSPGTNTYSKTTSINAMALQQALAQILPPPLNQTNVNENQQTPNTPGTPQVLHIVQSKNATRNQITLLDSTQQSVISSPNSTPLLHIVQNKGNTAGSTSNGTPTPQNNTFSGLSLVDTGLQQGGNQLLHIVNTGSQKNTNAGQLLKRVNLLTNLQGSNEQKMVQFVCKSADGKAIQLNAPHQRGMVLRLQPIESPNIQATQSKPMDSQDITSSPNTANTVPSKETVTSQQEIKSRSVYEENYAKFIQNSSNKTTVPEKATSLPKFNQAFGKQVFQDGNQKQNEINNTNSHLSSVNNNSDANECQSDNAMNLDHISQMSSPPLLLRKSPAQTSQAQSNLVQQIKQTIAPMNLQTMHGGVIYTRQIPVNIGAGQTINLITVPSTELIDDSTQKHQTDVKFVNQGEIEPSIIKIVPQTQTTSNSDVASEENNAHMGVSNENSHTPQPQQVLTQMRIKLPMLSKTPQMVSGTRVVRPSFFQIQRNVIGGANQPVYQQLVLTAAPPLGQQTIRLPQPQTQSNRQIKIPAESQSSSESHMSSSTLEQLREFDLVLEQVKERSTVQPNATSCSSPFSKLHTPSTDSTDGSTSASSTSTESTQQVLYSIGNNHPLNVAYVNRKASATVPTTSTFVRSPDSSAIADSPTSSTHIQIPHTVTSDSSTSETPAQSKPTKVSSKSKSRPKTSSNPPNTLKLNTVPPKTSVQKPLEDEQTTQRILYILAEYKEQVENSPDKDKPAPRRRSNPPSNPSGSSKRKKSSSSSRRPGARDISPVHGEDTCRTMGSEDSSCGTSQGDCNESCIDSHSPQDSPRKVVRKLTFEQETPITQSRPQPQRNVIVADGQTITVARGTAGKPATAVLMPANYILPVSMVKGGQQIAIVTNRGPKLLTVGGGEGGATNALLLQRLIGPAGLKPVLARPGVRHVRLPTAALHNLQAFNLATATTVHPPDSTASPAPAPKPPELIETRATSSPWTDRESQDVKPERGSSPEGSEPWNLPSSADPHDYTYEEPVQADNMSRTVLDSIPDQYSSDTEAQRIFDKMFDVDSKKSYMVDSHDDSPRCGYDIDGSDCDDKAYHQVVHKKDGSSQRQHRLTHVSAAALRHKYAILEHELRLQKSLSEECEDLGVDSPSASELFPEAELLFAASPAHDHTQEHVLHHSNTPQPTLLNQSGIPQPDMDDQIATDQLLTRSDLHEDRPELGLGLEDVGIVTVSEDGLQATVTLDHEEFARAHPNTTFHSEPTDDAEVQPFTISGLKGRHITSTIFHSNRTPGTVLMTAPQTTVISQATAESSGLHNVKYDIDNMINSLPTSHTNNINLSSVLVKDDGLARFDNILNDTRELHLSNTASAIVHSGHATQVIRRVCYDDDKRDTRFLIDEPDTLIAGDDAKMIAEDSSREALESIADVDDDRSSPERHTELFWESNSASERSESRRPLDFSSDSDKCCKSPFDETNSTDSSGVGAHMRLDSVIKEARGVERSGSADGSSADDTHPPLRTYPPKRLFHSLEGDTERSTSGKTRAGERSPDSLEVRRRASGRGVVKRGCHCCNGSPAPPRPKKPRQKKPTLDFTTNH